MTGDGIKDCPDCRGRGVVEVEMEGLIVPATRPCKCVEARDRYLNMNRRWSGLGKVRPVKESPLVGREGDNLRIRATHKVFKRHMHRVALGQPPEWFFSVESDRELAKAWLYKAKQEGEVYDGDVIAHTPKYATLEDLTDHAKLLIVLVGVKAARNNAAPELLVDVVRGRDFLGKPTWVVDEPHYPLAPGHISYSELVEYEFEDWDFVELASEEASPKRKRQAPPASVKPRPGIPNDHEPEVVGSSQYLDKLLTEKKKKKW